MKLTKQLNTLKLLLKKFMPLLLTIRKKRITPLKKPTMLKKLLNNQKEDLLEPRIQLILKKLRKTRSTLKLKLKRLIMLKLKPRFLPTLQRKLMMISI
jgi:hypothetical protein